MIHRATDQAKATKKHYEEMSLVNRRFLIGNVITAVVVVLVVVLGYIYIMCPQIIGL